MSDYKQTVESLQSARRLVGLKIERKNMLLKRYKRKVQEFDVARTKNIQDILLLEARVAKYFWHEFRALLPSGSGFLTRTPYAQDITNRLLDVGYHHLTNTVKKLLEEQDVSMALGLLHVARNADSAPLAYDLVEMFRADIVDAEVLRFLRLKKREFKTLEQNTIAHFLHEVNERLEKKYYLRDFKLCHTYRYYMELQILKFIKAVNHSEIFSPLHLPTRHDTRCRLTPPTVVLPSNAGVPHIG